MLKFNPIAWIYRCACHLILSCTSHTRMFATYIVLHRNGAALHTHTHTRHTNVIYARFVSRRAKMKTKIERQHRFLSLGWIYLIFSCDMLFNGRHIFHCAQNHSDEQQNISIFFLLKTNNSEIKWIFFLFIEYDVRHLNRRAKIDVSSTHKSHIKLTADLH